VVQSSAMDCGPASLRAVLEGFGVPISFGRLREACQTEVDGTCIDTLEEVAVQLGLSAEQVIVPADHLLVEGARCMPALCVVRLPSGLSHFVVLWSHYRGLVQTMDPGTGRRWRRASSFLNELQRHAYPVPAAAWRAWAEGPDFTRPLLDRMHRLRIPEAVVTELVTTAFAEPGWLAPAALDAAVRMVTSLVRSRGVHRGREAAGLVRRSLEHALSDGPDDRLLPETYWSVRPLPASEGAAEEPAADRATSPRQQAEQAARLALRGVVVVRFLGLRERRRPGPAPAAPEPEPVASDGSAEASPTGAPPAAAPQDAAVAGDEETLPPELVAALTEPPQRPGRDLWRLLRRDPVLAPITVICAVGAAAFMVIAEALLFRGLLDIHQFLGLADQRAAAIAALAVFLTLATVLELPLASTVLRLGRRLEMRLRMAFLDKLPRLADRYFRSRLSSDMAERAHSAHGLRRLPGLASRLLRSAFLLLFTTVGIAWLDPRSTLLAAVVAVLSVVLPMIAQRFLVERDLRVRTHAGALTRYYLDAMLGLMPIRCHSAELAVRREHEALLVEWARAHRGRLQAATVVQGVLSLVGIALAAWLLAAHLHRAGESGMVLLLVYWALSLPAIGQSLATAASQYPGLRNITLRLLEPLEAPDETSAAATEEEQEQEAAGPSGRDGDPFPAVAIRLRDVTVRMGGHTILHQLDAEIPAGSHVAVVGPSGAGKSTLVGLLLGWTRPAAGELEVDGRLLDAGDLAGLRRRTAWVDPAVQLWNRSLVDNLCYGAERTAGPDLATVLEAASLHSVLERLPDGLQTVLGEGGGLVSGGEGQRVRFGRALRRADVGLVILDEPFRGLDRELRHRLLEAARQLWSSATLVCVTHDLEETTSFDRVLVIDSGRIVEDGPPDELRHRQGGHYQEMLAAERQVLGSLWGDPRWRRVRLEQGRLVVDRVQGAQLAEGVDGDAG